MSNRDNDDSDSSAKAWPPKTPEEALAAIKEAAEAGNIEFASDTLTSQLDTEIQEIFRELTFAYRGRYPTRAIWTADGVSLGVILDRDPTSREYTRESLEACRTAAEKLGIELSPRMTWEEAALQLRGKRAKIRS